MTASLDTTGVTPLTAEFHGTPITIIERDGHKWLTADQVGNALGYTEALTRISVMKLYSRHQDEFTEMETCVVKLTMQGQARDVRIFSATGCIKLGFFANTKRAKKFRAWASEVLAGQSSQDLADQPDTAQPDTDTLALYRHMNELHKQLGERNDQIISMLQGQNQTLSGQVVKLTGQVERLCGKVISTQGQLIRTQKHVTTLVEGRMDGAQASEAIVQMHQDGHSNAQIVAATGRNHNHVRQKLWQARRDGVLPSMDTPASTQTGLFAEAA